MRKDRVEAIVVAFNNGRALVRGCEALLRQPEVDRVRVVDNSPGGADAALIKSNGAFGDDLIATANRRNRGFGPAVNDALNKVTSDYVALVNPDGVVGQTMIGHLVRALEHDSGAVLAGARLLGHDGVEQTGSRRREPTPARLIVNTVARAFRLPRAYRFGFEMSDAPLPIETLPVGAVSGACMVARTEALRAIGGFDERFFLHFEDLDLCKQLRDAGGRILFVPDAEFHHEGGGSSASRPYFVIWHKHLSMVKYYCKHYRGIRSGGLWLPLIVAMAAFRCGFLMLRQAASAG